MSPWGAALVPGTPIVGTPEGLGRFFGLGAGEVAAAIAAAGLEPWGIDGADREVWRLRDVDRALGRPDPPPAPRRGRSIPGTRWAATAHQGAQGRRSGSPAGPDAPGARLGPSAGREGAGG